MDRQKDRLTNRQKDRLTDRQKDRLMDIQFVKELENESQTPNTSSKDIRKHKTIDGQRERDENIKGWREIDRQTDMFIQDYI